MSYMVFWVEAAPTDFSPSFSQPRCQPFGDLQMMEALKHADAMRKAGHRHVCLSSADPDRVGSDGVDAVEGRKLPNGEDYTWSKQHRGGQKL